MKISYQEADKFIRVNEDPDMIPIKIYLPKPPEAKLIEGHGLAPKDQFFKRMVEPARLRGLQQRKDEKGNHISIPEMWSFLSTNRDEYKDEINFIKKMWYHRIYGYWFYNNGKPTYITGKHFYYLNCFRVEGKLPEYRDRDRKYWLFIKFCETDTYDFVNKDDEGNAIADENGYYHMVDVGRKVCLGDAYPKFRREGATFRAQCNMCYVITMSKEANGGIQSRNDKDAEKVFRKNLVRPFKKIPFYFKPLYASSTDPKKEILFDVPADMSSASRGVINTGLESQINYEDGDVGAYDGWPLKHAHDDESGKNKRYNIWERHLIKKECLTENFGMKIKGYISYTSTAGEMESGGGKQFWELCQKSNYYNRTAIGQTVSGLYVLFMSSVDGVVPCDKYGFSDEVEGKKILEDVRSNFLAKNDLLGWVEKTRQFPIYYREAFMTSSFDMGFNIAKIQKRIAELKIKSYSRRGDLIRIDPTNKTSVIKFVDNPNGRFVISKELSEGEANQKFYKSGIWYPKFGDKYTGGSDPFRLAKTEGSRKSDGGGYVFWERDLSVDPDSKDIQFWESNRTVCTYLFRPSTPEEYADDMLKMCLYWGCFMSTETNVSTIIEWFTKWGCNGYLLYFVDDNGRPRGTPGMHAGENSQQLSMLAIANYIEMHCHRECHLDFLMQLLEIPSISKITDYDLVAAAGVAHRGSERGYRTWVRNEVKNDRVDMGSILGISLRNNYNDFNNLPKQYRNVLQS